MPSSRRCRAASCDPDPGQLDLFRVVAGDEMAWSDFVEVGRLRAAELYRMGAAGLEVAA